MSHSSTIQFEDKGTQRNGTNVPVATIQLAIIERYDISFTTAGHNTRISI